MVLQDSVSPICHSGLCRMLFRTKVNWYICLAEIGLVVLVQYSVFLNCKMHITPIKYIIIQSVFVHFHTCTHSILYTNV